MSYASGGVSGWRVSSPRSSAAGAPSSGAIVAVWTVGIAESSPRLPARRLPERGRLLLLIIILYFRPSGILGTGAVEADG